LVQKAHDALFVALDLLLGVRVGRIRLIPCDIEMARDLGQKAAGCAGHGLAITDPILGSGDIEVFFGACDTHIAEPALFAVVMGLFDGSTVGNQSVFKSDQKDHGVLQAL
jgi:hypothetical protein